MAITLFTIGPMFGLPDPSPFVTKADLLLRMSGLPYTVAPANFRKAPKGKVPYLQDGDTVVADSTFIRWHLETRHGVAFDEGYDPAETAFGWAVEKMLEDHLYWAIAHARWADDANFENGPARFFDAAPKPLRPLVKAFIRRQVAKSLRGHGMGRHARPEVEALGVRSIEALSTLLGDRPYLLGPRVSGYDATIYAFVAGTLCPAFETPLRKAAEAKANLVAYERRMRAQYYPELTPLAG